MEIPFNKPFIIGRELSYIAEVYSNNILSGDGPFTKKCQIILEQKTNSKKVLITHSCTAALEMAAILADIKPGDEIIMPSYTFVSSANPFVLRGGIPVFVDIRPDTLNIDETLIEEAITSKTKVIVPVHYAGVACEMDTIMAIAKKYNLLVIEDAAHGIFATYKNRMLGSIGHLGCYSFHETKNVISGEGGALLINDYRFIERAEIIREKGTNRSQFFRGMIDKYTWVDIGSSYLPGELIAAFLFAQLEKAQDITKKRLKIWKLYNDQLFIDSSQKLIRCPVIPNFCNHNGHMYYILLSKEINRSAVIEKLKKKNIQSLFHYVPLHSSPAGLKYGRVCGSMDVTNFISEQLLRLPMWIGLKKYQQDKICQTLKMAINN